ncbi:unnamed protein product [Cuscuta campestris]|uniref:Signal recognition particle receptor subunit beta n=1 Tax=Cuscuta campestris TaxID=132261 RepID=A0A484M090_9ASTE|nr:unnamed protein product [Cuscuta campestris]
MDIDQFEGLKVQALQWVHRAAESVHQIPFFELYFAIGILAITTFWFLLLTRLRKRAACNTIVLTGLCGSGKTFIFHQLRDGTPPQQGTVTSMEPNEDTFILHSEKTKGGKIRPVRVVDVPGHPRLRPTLDGFLPLTAGVVFVVDSIDFLPNLRAASEYLYDILTHAHVVKRKIPVLLLCNKVDKEITAHTKEFITKQLEKEIDKLRSSRTAVSDADISSEFTLGTPGEQFKFSQCQNQVVVKEGSGLTGKLEELEEFIRQNV